jgi:serine/threonine protein kinase
MLSKTVSGITGIEDLDYGQVLSEMGVKTIPKDLYYQVGDIRTLQGWILYVSVIKSQINAALELIAETSLANQFSFKVIKNSEAAEAILEGKMGIQHVGKVIIIYPDTDEKASKLADLLSELTSNFDGPLIPCAAYLGGQIFARYGTHNGILVKSPNGSEYPHFLDMYGTLTPDLSPVPFNIPPGVVWPFHNFNIPTQKLGEFHSGYNIIQTLKEHPRGNVLLLQPTVSAMGNRLLVAKEGKPYMSVDDTGRSMVDRIRYQAEVHKILADKVPLPIFKDYFLWNGSEYFVMEFIEGKSVYQAVAEINNRLTWWPVLANDRKLLIIDIFLGIAQALQLFHNAGYIHRDVSPVNFMVGLNGEIKMIDIEMSYCINSNTPAPPFEPGAIGFTSPQQEQRLTPSIKDDIFGFGATILTLISYHSPYRLSSLSDDNLKQKIHFFLGNSSICDLVSRMLHHDPAERPVSDEIIITLKKYRRDIFDRTAYHSTDVEINGLRQFIQKGVIGLGVLKIPNNEYLWMTPATTDWNAGPPVAYASPRFGDGIAGILHTIFKLEKEGYSIDILESWIQRGKEYLWQTINNKKEMTPGYISGSGGIAVAISSIPDMNTTESSMQIIQQLLSVDSEVMDFNNGLVGQGLAILECFPTENEFAKARLGFIEERLIKGQCKPGEWIPKDGDFSGNYNLDYYSGNAAIIKFLVIRAKTTFNNELKNIIINTRNYVVEAVTILLNIISESNYPGRIFEPAIHGQLLGGINALIDLYKYEETKDVKLLLQKTLNVHSNHMLLMNHSYNNGLTALGFLYIKAFQLLSDEEYLRKAKWICSLLMNTAIVNSNWAAWRTGRQDLFNLSIDNGACGILLLLSEMEGIQSKKEQVSRNQNPKNPMKE